MIGGLAIYALKTKRGNMHVGMLAPDECSPMIACVILPLVLFCRRGMRADRELPKLHTSPSWKRPAPQFESWAVSFANGSFQWLHYAKWILQGLDK